MTPRVVIVALATIMVAACSGSSAPSSTGTAPDATPVQSTALVADPAPDATVADTTRDAAEEGEARPGGRVSVTIGERTWTFPEVVCLFDVEAAQVGASFALSATSDGFEIYASIGDERHVVTLDDVGDVAAGSVSWTSSDPTPFIRVRGRAVSATTTFVRADAPGGRAVQGTLEAECP